MYSLIITAKLNGIDPQAWFADVLARIAHIPQHRLGELLPCNWQVEQAVSRLVDTLIGALACAADRYIFSPSSTLSSSNW